MTPSKVVDAQRKWVFPVNRSCFNTAGGNHTRLILKAISRPGSVNNDSLVDDLDKSIAETGSSTPQRAGLLSEYYFLKGNCYMLAGDRGRAIDAFETALEKGGANSLLAGQICENLGLISEGYDDYSEAVAWYLKARMNYKPLVSFEPENMIRISCELADVYEKQNQQSIASRYYKEALKVVYPESINDTLLFQINVWLGRSSQGAGQFLQAIRYFRRALGNTSDGLRYDKHLRYCAYKGLGSCFFAMHESDSSVLCFQRALALNSLFDIESREEVADTYCRIGKGSLLKGDVVCALSSFKLGLSEVSQDFISPYILYEAIHLHHERALCWIRLSRQTDSTLVCLHYAFSDLREAISLAELYNDLPGSQEAKIIFNEKLNEICSVALDLGSRLNCDFHEDLIPLLFIISEACRGKVLYGKFKDCNSQAMVPDIDSSTFFNHVKASASRSRLRMEADAFARVQGIESVDSLVGKGQSPGDFVMRIEEKLDSGEAVLEYFLGQEELFVFCITKDSITVGRKALTENFPKELKDYVCLLKTADTRYFPEASKALYHILIGPVQEQLKGAQLLHIIPHRELFLIPFETLISPEGKNLSAEFSEPDYLVRDFEIIYHNSAGIFYNRENTGEQKLACNRFVGFAPGQFPPGPGSTGVSSLPASLDEVLSISSILGKKGFLVSDLLGDDATERRVKSEVPGKSIIHIATHSLLDETLPGGAGLFLPEHVAGSGADDGILDLDEIENLSIKADLVVLSACSAGKGKMSPAEGPLSLSRGFLVAGAANVLYSMWDIPDTYTRDLMVLFYEAFLEGKSYSAALREAKLRMISVKSSSLPLVWAGFMLTGR